MTIQEAIKEGLERPIKDLGTFIITRKGQRSTCGAMFLTLDEKGPGIKDWERDEDDTAIAKLALDDLMAKDWVLEDYDLRG